MVFGWPEDQMSMFHSRSGYPHMKREIIIHDYGDLEVPMLARMYDRCLNGIFDAPRTELPLQRRTRKD